MKKDISSIVIVFCVIGILVIAGFISIIKLIDIIAEPSEQKPVKLITKTTEATTNEPPEATASTPELNKLKIDSYTSWWSTHEEFLEGDFNFSITGDDEGTMYLMNATTLEMQKKDFNYSYVGNILTFDFDDGTKSEYRVSENEIGNMVLHEKESFNLYHNCYSYSDYMLRSFSSNEFTAFGCWYLYNINEDYLETISLWHNWEGMYYNSVENEPKSFSYDYSNYVLTLKFEDYTKEYTINHLGNVLELLDGETGQETFMFRAHETILKGIYHLDTSSNDSLTKMSIWLKRYGIIKIDYSKDDKNIYALEDSWYVDRGDGYLGIHGGEQDDEYELEYCYYLTKDGLYLVETDYSDTYYLKKVD